MTRPLIFLTTFLLSLLHITLTNADLIKRDVSPASNLALPGNWTYVGCWNDTQGDRTLSGASTADSKNMNATACITYCSNKNFVYAGTEYGDECYCGNILGAASTLQSDSTCSMGCAYNSSEACGAGNELTIYYANKPAPQGPITNLGPPGWTSMGCWTDGGTRTLGHGVSVAGGQGNMSVVACTTACDAAGYSLAGVEYASQWYVKDVSV